MTNTATTTTSQSTDDQAWRTRRPAAAAARWVARHADAACIDILESFPEGEFSVSFVNRCGWNRTIRNNAEFQPYLDGGDNR